MDAPSLSLGFYTFKYDTTGFTTPVTFGDNDGFVRSVMLEASNGASTDFYLTYENGNVLLNFPNIPASPTKAYTKIPLRHSLRHHNQYSQRQTLMESWCML